MMTSTQESSTRRERTVIYVATAAVIVVLLVIGLLAYRVPQPTPAAAAKADQLVAKFEAAGVRAPAAEQVVRVLGDDGGAVCTAPNAALNRAVLQSPLSNGAGGPGARPVIADGRTVAGETMVIEVYCPQELAGFQQYVAGLGFADVAGGSAR